MEILVSDKTEERERIQGSSFACYGYSFSREIETKSTKLKKEKGFKGQALLVTGILFPEK